MSHYNIQNQLQQPNQPKISKHVVNLGLQTITNRKQLTQMIPNNNELHNKQQKIAANWSKRDKHKRNWTCNLTIEGLNHWVELEITNWNSENPNRCPKLLIRVPNSWFECHSLDSRPKIRFCRVRSLFRVPISTWFTSSRLETSRSVVKIGIQGWIECETMIRVQNRWFGSEGLECNFECRNDLIECCIHYSSTGSSDKMGFDSLKRENQLQKWLICEFWGLKSKNEVLGWIDLKKMSRLGLWRYFSAPF